MTQPESNKRDTEEEEISFWQGTLSLFLRTFLLFLAIEIVLRWVGMDPRQVLVNSEGPYIRHESRNWALKPNYSRVWAGTQVNINAQGLREEAITYAKAPNEFRILVLGGSVTFAYGVAVEKGYVSQLEEILQKTLPTGKFQKIRTVNTGVGGYSTFQQLQYLKEEGFKFSPDLVILSFGLNDVLERYLIVEKYGGSGVYRGGQMTEINLTAPKSKKEAFLRFLQNLPRKTAFYSLARNIKVRIIAKKEGTKEIKEQAWMDRQVIHGEMSPKMLEAWKQSLHEIDEWDRLTRNLGAKSLLLVFPSRLQVEEGTVTDKPQQMLRAFCQERGIPFVDLMREYLARSPQDLFFDHDHPTELGHELAAQALAKMIIKENLLTVNLAQYREMLRDF